MNRRRIVRIERMGPLLSPQDRAWLAVRLWVERDDMAVTPCGGGVATDNLETIRRRAKDMQRVAEQMRQRNAEMREDCQRIRLRNIQEIARWDPAVYEYLRAARTC